MWLGVVQDVGKLEAGRWDLPSSWGRRLLLGILRAVALIVPATPHGTLVPGSGPQHLRLRGSAGQGPVTVPPEQVKNQAEKRGLGLSPFTAKC